MKRLIDLYAETKFLALDTETTGDIKKNSVWDDSIQMHMLSYAYIGRDGQMQSGTLKVGVDDKEIIHILRTALYSPKHTLVLWEAPFDIPIIYKYLQAKGQWNKVTDHICDAKLLAQTVLPDQQPFSLKRWARIYFGNTFASNEWEDTIKKYIREHKCNYSEVPDSLLMPYARLDAEATLMVWEKLRAELHRMDVWECWELEAKCQIVTLQMMANGFAVDTKRVTKYANQSETEVLSLRRTIDSEAKLLGFATFNPDSPKQLGTFLETLDPGYSARAGETNKGSIKTDANALLKCKHPLAPKIRKYRMEARAIRNYYRALGTRTIRGRIHYYLNQGTAVTGRYSSSEPNLQNQPRVGDSGLGRVRSCYVAPRGKALLFCDFDQIELRLAALLSRDYESMAAINSGVDLHDRTCRQLFKVNNDNDKWNQYRYLAKTCNFVMLYGAGWAKLQETIKDQTNAEIDLTDEVAKGIVDKWWQLRPAVLQYRERLLTEVALMRYIRTSYGRLIPCDSGHKALNYMIQGTAADIMKWALVKVYKWCRQNTHLGIRPLVTVHDEIGFELLEQPEESLIQVAHQVTQVMMPWTQIDSNNQILLTAGAKSGPSWGELQTVPPF